MPTLRGQFYLITEVPQVQFRKDYKLIVVEEVTVLCYASWNGTISTHNANKPQNRVNFKNVLLMYTKSAQFYYTELMTDAWATM